MSSTMELAAKLTALEAIPTDQVKIPTMPIKQVIHEAETLFSWCPKDQAALEGAGLDWNLVLDLPVRAGALREAESNWFNERHSREQAELLWSEKAPAAYALRDHLLRYMRFAYRNDANLMKRVAEISEGTGHIDMVQDLNDLALFGRANLELLLVAKFNPAELDQAGELSDEMGALLGQMNGNRMENSTAKLLRDRAYTHLKAAMDDIRAHGQFVFWNQPERRIGYASNYFRKQQKSSAAQPAPAETSDA